MITSCRWNLHIRKISNFYVDSSTSSVDLYNLQLLVDFLCRSRLLIELQKSSCELLVDLLYRSRLLIELSKSASELLVDLLCRSRLQKSACELLVDLLCS